MSGGGSPSDPFGRNERTIIRPNPAGRRAEPLAPASPSPMPPLPVSPPPVSPQSTGDEWATTSMPPPRAAEPVEHHQRAVIIRREELITPNESPVMRAAGPESRAPHGDEAPGDWSRGA